MATTNSKAFANILGAVQKMKSGTVAQDPNADKFWKAETDKSGNGFAIIRFLPGKTDDDVPFVKTYNHGFKSAAGKWFIENCPTTIGQNCPVCEANGVLWNSGHESDKEIVRERKRRQSYVANVLVVSDPKNPDNEGKVFLFKFGAKIFDKLVDKMQPQFDDEAPVNPFDPVEGANFKLKIRRVEGYANFDKSEFEAVSKVEDISVLDNITNLNEFIDPKNFKTFEALQTKLNTVLGTTAAAGRAENVSTGDDADDATFAKQVASASNAKATPKAESTDSGDGEDDDLAYFKRLASED